MEAYNYYQQRKSEVEKLSIIDVIRQFGYEVEQFSNHEYKVKGYGGLVVNAQKNNFYWFSQNKGGGILQFLDYVHGLNHIEALNILLGDPRTGERKKVVQSKLKPEIQSKEPRQVTEKKMFSLPPKIPGKYRNLYAYLLQTRKIHKDVVSYYVHQRDIYENNKHSIVFVGKDETNKARSASWRSTSSNQNFNIRGCVEGSDKSYPFAKKGLSNTVYVFESPIDLMSFQSFKLLKDGKKFTVENLQSHYISLDGLMSKGLDSYLKREKDICNIVFCLDNDQPGREARDNYNKHYKNLGYNVFSVNLPEGVKDWNELLVKEEKSREQFSDKFKDYNMEH